MLISQVFLDTSRWGFIPRAIYSDLQEEEMSNDRAYHPKDATKTLIKIDKWLVKYGPEILGCCRVCNLPIKVRAEKSAATATHFVHQSGALCPTIEENHKPYESLKALPRDPMVADAARQYVRDNAVAIYEKCRKVLPRLSWKEFFALIEKANSVDIWSLKDMPHFFLPYVLMTCADKFDAIKPDRPNDCFFVLEPFPTGTTNLWNISAGYKKYLWRVDLPARTAWEFEIVDDLPLPWYIAKVNKLLP